MTVHKLIEVVGTSRASTDDAIRTAIARASGSVEDLEWFEVKEVRGRVAGSGVAEFQVRLRIGFMVHEPRRGRATTREPRAEPRGRGPRARTTVARRGGASSVEPSRVKSRRGRTGRGTQQR